MEINSLNTSLDQLVRKKTLIHELDQKIEAKITDAKELESEIFEAEELSCELEEKDRYISTINIQFNVITQGNIGTSSSAISQNTNTVYVGLSLSSVNVQSQTHVQSMTSCISSAENDTNPLNISTPSEDTPTTQLPRPILAYVIQRILAFYISNSSMSNAILINTRHR